MIIGSSSILNMEKNRPKIEEDEIDLIEVVKTIWASRNLIYKVTIVFIILGLVVAFGSKVEYEASCKLLPDNEEGTLPNLGGLGGLAGLAGVNLDLGGQGVLSPDLYPEIVQSLPFQLQIINKKLRFENKDTTTSSYTYFNEIDSPSLFGYILGLPGKIKGLFSPEEETIILDQDDSGMIRLSKEDNDFIEGFTARIDVNVDPKTGIISINTELPDPVAAAELALESTDLLQQQIIQYKISKAQENLRFIKDRYDEAKEEFERTQVNLAAFNDRNQNVVTARAQTESQRLQNEYNLAFDVYQGLAKQLEQAELKVKEDTPVFTIVEPVYVPTEKSKPRRTLTLIIFTMLGFFIALIYIYLKYTITTKISSLRKHSS